MGRVHNTYQLRGFSHFRLTVDQIASLLEEADDILDATIYIEPPENAALSDGDSDDEDPTGDINRLSGNQLRAGAELVYSKVTENGLEKVRCASTKSIEEEIEEIVDNEDITSPMPSTSSEPRVIHHSKRRKVCCRNTNNANTIQNLTDPKTIPNQDCEKRKHAKKEKKKKGGEVKRKKGVNERVKKRGEIKKIRTWESKDIIDRSMFEFTRSKYLQNDFTPVELFEFFFDDEVIDYIVECTNKFALEQGKLSLPITKSELRLFFAILFLSGYNVLSRTRMYWETSEDVHNIAVSKAMSRNRFEEILRYIHFCDNSKLTSNDRFGKVRPVWSMLNERWLQYFPGDPYLAIDESMIPYYGRYGAKQHIHGKPIRFGYKIWILSTRLGYVVQGEPYQGKSTGISIPGLGLGGSVVFDLISELPEGRRYSLFFDNFFTSFRLLEELQKKGYDGTGTVRVDRVEKAPLTEPKILKKQPRGTFCQVTERDTNITLVRYNDNNVFTIASNVCGVQPIVKKKRWSSSEKKHIFVNQPASVNLYNTFMGGVDRIDENIASYRIKIRNKKWYWPLISYLLSVSMNNAWQIYRMTPKGRDEELDFLGFIRYVVQAYLASYTKDRPAAGRPSKKVSARVIPDVRYNGKAHHLETVEKQVRCGYCGKATRKKCKICQVGCHILCSEAFHTRPA